MDKDAIVVSKDFKTFSDALSWMLTDVLADEFYLELDEFEENLSTTEILACSLEKSERLEQALLMLSTACQWADHGSKH